VAYGARLESVLGESPRGFESPILRHQEKALPFSGAPFLDAWNVVAFEPGFWAHGVCEAAASRWGPPFSAPSAAPNRWQP
jgi:hypothetical protein